MRRFSILVIALCLMVGVAGVSAQSAACLPGLSGADCTNYQAAISALSSARSLGAEFEVLNRTSMGNISNTDIYISGIVELALAPDGAITNLVMQGDFVAELSGMMLNARQSSAFGFVIFEGGVYVGSGPFGTMLPDMTWEGFEAGPAFRLTLGDANPITEMAQYGATWSRDDSVRTPDIPSNIVFYTSIFQTNSPMATAMGMLGGMAGGSQSESVMGALMGSMFGAGMDSSMPGTATTRAMVTLDTNAQRIAGLSTLSAVGFDMSNMMGSDMLSGMVGTTSQQYNGVNLRFHEYDHDFYNQAPPSFTPMSPGRANAIRNLSGLGLQGMMAAHFLPQAVTGLLSGSNTASADAPDASDILDSMLGQTTTASSQTDMIAGLLSGMMGGAMGGSGSSGGSSSDPMMGLLSGMMGGMMGGSGSSGSSDAMMGLLSGLMGSGSGSSSAPAGATGGGAIEIGQTVSGRLSNSRDEWTFSGTAGTVVNISLDGTFDTYLELYGPSGSMVASDDDGGSGLNSLISGLTLPATGNYRIVARAFGGNGTGTYNLSLSQSGAASGTSGTGGLSGLLSPTQAAPASSGGTIEIGQTVSGTLSNSQASWTFTGTTGQTLSISMEGTFDTYLELYGPSGSMIASDDDGGQGLNSLIASVRLTQDGTYRIVARGFGGNATGSYTLTLSALDASAAGGTIEMGQTISGALSGAPAYWTFTISAPQRVRIDMTGTFDTYLELNDPNGRLIASDDDGGDGLNSRITINLTQAGTYTIVARGYSSRPTGSYQLTLSQ